MVEAGDLTDLREWLMTKGIKANDLVAWTKDEKELPKSKSISIKTISSKTCYNYEEGKKARITGCYVSRAC